MFKLEFPNLTYFNREARTRERRTKNRKLKKKKKSIFCIEKHGREINEEHRINISLISTGLFSMEFQLVFT